MSRPFPQLPNRLRLAVLLALFLLGAKHAAKAQQPGLTPTVSPPSRSSTAGTYVPVGDNATIKVNFPSAPIQAIIPFYTQLTGKKLILDSALQGEQLRIISPQMLTKKDAIAFIEATMLLNGYVIIHIDDNTAKLINHAGGKSPTADGLKVYNSIRDLPDTEEICHYVLPLQHISADQASKAFQQVIKLHTYGAITPISNDSALIITENSTTIRSICEIAEIVDVPPAEIANEMIKLERSDVELVAEIVTEIFAQEEKSEGSAPTVPVAAVPNAPGRPGAPAALNPAGSTNTAATNPAASRVKVFPYRRTNELLVIGRPVDITYIRGLVEKLDKQDDGGNFLKRRLKYLDVLDFLPVAYNALARDTDIQANEGTASIDGGGSRRRSSSGSNSGGSDNSGFNSAFGSNNNGFGSSSGLNTGNNASRSVLDEPEDLGAPKSMIVGKTQLIADPQSNSLVVSGSPEHIARIDQLLTEMDVRPQQIYISAIIGQLNLGNDYNFGFDFLKLLDDFSVRRNDDTTTTTGTGTTAGLTTGGIQFPANFNNFSWNQLNFYGQIGSLSQYLKLIDGNRDFKVLASPRVFAKNAAKSVISSGQRIAVPAQILSNGGFVGGVASNSVSVEYRDVLLKLEVVPHINSDDEVTLEIAQINDNIVGTQTISGNTVPTIGTQELRTEVTVKNGATVVLGGLITERVTNSKRGAVILRHIPVLGHLFGTTSKENIREELLIFIQPHIIASGDRLDTPNNIEASRTNLFHESMQFADPSMPNLEDIPRALPARN